MAFTGITTNTGTGGPVVATQTYSSKHYPANVLTYGPDAGPFAIVDVPTPLPVSLGDGQKLTYSCSGVGFVPVSGATDVFEINNSAGTKTIKVTRIEFSASAGTAVLLPVTLIKRSTLNSSGTSTTPTITPHSSGDAAATGVVKVYTANPTVGSTAGNVRTAVYNAPISGNLASPLVWEFGTRASTKAITLAANQSLCVSLGATAISSGLAYISVEFTEE